MIKNIIFDWAGCLVNDLDQNYQAIMYIFDKLGVEKITLDEFKESFFLPYTEWYRKYTDASPEELKKLFIEGLAQADKPALFHSTKEVLESLKDKGIKIALLSSHPLSAITKESKEFGVDDYFTDIMGDVLDKTKVINTLIEKNGFSPSETAYVGDMVHDIEAGREAGVVTIAVSWGFQSKQKLADNNPDHLIDDIKEILNIIS